MNTATIPTSFTKYGATLQLIEREGRVTAWSVVSPAGRLVNYEVMVIQQRKPAMLGGRYLPGGEALPSSSLWGVFGWTFLPTEADRMHERFAKACKHFNPPVRRIVRRIKR